MPSDVVADTARWLVQVAEPVEQFLLVEYVVQVYFDYLLVDG